jgi:hypothetical protein
VRTSIRNPHASISVAEAQRAIFVDFEGFKYRPPSLLGILVDGSLTQAVLDSRLTAAAAAKGCFAGDIRDVAAALQRRCREEGRKLVGYSQHELQVFAKYGGIDFCEEYRDARMIAKRWWNKCRPGAARQDNGLKSFLEAIGRPCPAYFGQQKMTTRLRAVITMLRRRVNYESLTPLAKAEWQNLLDYNAYDCRGMQALVALAAKEVAGSHRERSPRS